MSGLIIYLVLTHLMVYFMRIGDHKCVCDTGNFVDSTELEDDRTWGGVEQLQGFCL